MTSDQPEVKPTSRYSVSDVCRMLCIHRHTLSRYVQMGYIKEGRSKLNGRPYYTGLEIIKLFNK